MGASLQDGQFQLGQWCDPRKSCTVALYASSLPHVVVGRIPDPSVCKSKWVCVRIAAVKAVSIGNCSLEASLQVLCAALVWGETENKKRSFLGCLL